MTIGEKIKELRKERGLTQEVVASALAVSRQAVAKWESGRSVPSTDNLLKLSGMFGVPLEELVDAKQREMPALEEYARRKLEEERTRGEMRKRASQKGKELAVTAAAYAADLFGIRALLVPSEGRVSLTQFQAIPGDLPPETYAKAENFLDAWAEWKAWRDEYIEKYDPKGSVGCGYDTGYGVRDETMGKMLEQIAAEHGLALQGGVRAGYVNVAWSSDTTGLTGEGFYTNEELAELTASFAGSGSIFAETPVGFDKVYWFPEGNFCVSWYYELPGGEWITCYGCNSRYDVLTNSREVGTAALVDSASFKARSHTAPDGTELTILSNGQEAYIYAWLENSFFAERVYPPDDAELTDEALDEIADTLIYSRIGK